MRAEAGQLVFRLTGVTDASGRYRVQRPVRYAMKSSLLYWPGMGTGGIFDALQALKYSNAVEVIDEVLASNPAATVADVRQYASAKGQMVDRRIQEAEARIERALCGHCGVEIVLGNDGAWYHGDIPSWGSRGCRSYSFNRLGTWDDMLDRRWTAAPG